MQYGEDVYVMHNIFFFDISVHSFELKLTDYETEIIALLCWAYR